MNVLEKDAEVGIVRQEAESRSMEVAKEDRRVVGVKEKRQRGEDWTEADDWLWLWLEKS